MPQVFRLSADTFSMHAHPDTDLHPLRQQLDDLLRHARINEEKMQRMDGFERQLIGAGSLEEILEYLLADYPARFGLQAVRLSLVDACSEIRRILGSEVAHAPWRDAIHLLPSDAPLAASFPAAPSQHTILSAARSASNGTPPVGNRPFARIAVLPKKGFMPQPYTAARHASNGLFPSRPECRFHC